MQLIYNRTQLPRFQIATKSTEMVKTGDIGSAINSGDTDSHNTWTLSIHYSKQINIPFWKKQAKTQKVPFKLIASNINFSASYRNSTETKLHMINK